MRHSKCGSEEFGTDEMTTEEVTIYAEVLLESDLHAKEAVAEIKFIDSLLWYKKRELFLNRETRLTRSGNHRKDSGYYKFMESGLQALIDNAKELKP